MTQSKIMSRVFAFALALHTASASAAELPKSGVVNREGTVERVVDNDTFILRDKLTNKKVDVHTNTNVQLAEGDRVVVNGTAESEALGIGHEIVDATIIMKTTGGMGGPYSPMDNYINPDDTTTYTD